MFIFIFLTLISNCDRRNCGFKIACDDMYKIIIHEKPEVDSMILSKLNFYVKSTYTYDSFFISVYKDTLINFVDINKKNQKISNNNTYYKIITHKNRQFMVFDDIILPAATFMILCANLKNYCENLKERENILYKIFYIFTNKQIKNSNIRKFVCNRNFLKSAGILILESIITQLESIIFSYQDLKEDVQKFSVIQDSMYMALEFDYTCISENFEFLQLFSLPTKDVFFSYIFRKREKRINMHLFQCLVLSYIFSACYVRNLNYFIKV